MRERCEVCDADDDKLSHPASLLTDLNSAGNMTCWVSEPSLTPSQVSLTLSLGKKFELTYVSMHFCSRRPDSMSLYKSADFGKTWSPFHYYSSDCKKVYGRQPDITITKHNEQVGFVVSCGKNPSLGSSMHEQSYHRPKWQSSRFSLP